MKFIEFVDIDECNSNPCMNNGQCINGVNIYDCDCSGTGYDGNQCQNGERSAQLFNDWRDNTKLQNVVLLV